MIAVTSEQECIDACKNDDKCNWYTYSPKNFYGLAGDSCYKFDFCNDTSTSQCPKCLSGEKACDEPYKPTCNEPKCCQGKIVTIDSSSSFIDCFAACKGNPKCNWATFYETLESCFLLSDCPTFSDDASNTCMTSEKRCEPPTPPTCNSTECCSGHIVDQFSFSNPLSCLEKCKKNSDCSWMTFRTDTEICYNLSDCELVPGPCKSAESRCETYGKNSD